MVDMEEELKSAYFLAKIFYKLYQEEEFIKNRKLRSGTEISSIINTAWKGIAVLVCSCIIYLGAIFGLTALVEFANLPNAVNGTIVLFVIIILFAYPIIVINWDEIALIIQIRKSKKKKQALDKYLEELSSNFAGIYDVIKQSYDVAVEDATLENFIPLFFTEFLCTLLIKDEDPLLFESVKRVTFNIANTKFILESLNLQEIVANNRLQKNLYLVLDGFQFLHSQQIADNNDSELQEILEEITNSIVYIDGIIQTLNEVMTNKKIIAQIDSNTEKMRALTKDQPVAKSNVKSIRTPSGFDREQFLSTLSALDEEVVEIRTRAGTYYASLSNIQQKDSKHREIGLSTDKELELKIEVLNNALELLEQEKANITDKEYQKIKSETLSELSVTKKTLDKRKGISKQILCPYCQNPCSPITVTCKACNNKLPKCIVCFNSIGVGEKVRICPHCQSFAHTDHFQDWLAENKTCPYCKRKIRRQLKETVLETMSKLDSSS